MPSEGGQQVGEISGAVGTVGIHEDHHLSPGMFHAHGAGAAVAGPWLSNDTRAVFFSDGDRGVPGAAIDEQDFEQQVLVDGRQDVGQAVCFVKGRDDEGSVHGDWGYDTRVRWAEAGDSYDREENHSI
jgi:hypothetical protein